MRRLIACLVLIACSSVVGCESIDNGEATRTEVQTLVKQFADAAQKDVNAMLAMYDAGAGTVSIADGQVQRGMEAIRKSADENLVGTQGKIKIDVGSIDVTSLGNGYAISVASFALTDTSSPVFPQQRKGVSSLVWKKTPQGWRVIHEHESYQPS